MQIRTLCAKVGRLMLAVLVLGVCTFSASFAHAQPPGQTETKAPPKTVQIAFVNATWRQVFQWLEEETGKPVRSCTPGGTFTFVGTPGKRYTIPEAIAIINEGLGNRPTHPFLLIPRDKFFSLRCCENLVGGGK